MSRLNAIRHGIFSSRIIGDGEETEASLKLLDQLRSDFGPKGAIESAIVEKLALTLWRN
ncbi:MAG: hypothetical protein AAGF51_10490 [Pseudomonadota bacterium]